MRLCSGICGRAGSSACWPGIRIACTGGPGTSRRRGHADACTRGPGAPFGHGNTEPYVLGDGASFGHGNAEPYALGDSVSFGHGVAEPYALRHAVISAAVRGYVLPGGSVGEGDSKGTCHSLARIQWERG